MATTESTRTPKTTRKFNLSERDRQALRILAAALHEKESPGAEPPDAEGTSAEVSKSNTQKSGRGHIATAVNWLLEERVAAASDATVRQWQERSRENRSNRALAGGRTKGYRSRSRTPVNLPEGLAERANSVLQRESEGEPVQLLYLSEAVRLALYEELQRRGLQENVPKAQPRKRTSTKTGGDEGDEGFKRYQRRWTKEERKAHEDRQKALDERTGVFKKAGKKSSGGRPPLEGEALTSVIPVRLSQEEQNLLDELGKRRGMNYQQVARQLLEEGIERPIRPGEANTMEASFPDGLRIRIEEERSGSGWAAPRIEESRSRVGLSVTASLKNRFAKFIDEESDEYPRTSYFRLVLWRAAGEEGISDHLPAADPPLK